MGHDIANIVVHRRISWFMAVALIRLIEQCVCVCTLTGNRGRSALIFPHFAHVDTVFNIILIIIIIYNSSYKFPLLYFLSFPILFIPRYLNSLSPYLPRFVNVSPCYMFIFSLFFSKISKKRSDSFSTSIRSQLGKLTGVNLFHIVTSINRIDNQSFQSPLINAKRSMPRSIISGITSFSTHIFAPHKIYRHYRNDWQFCQKGRKKRKNEIIVIIFLPLPLPISPSNKKEKSSTSSPR